MLEELRVSYFAQALGTARPVSEQRVLRAIDRAGHTLTSGTGAPQMVLMPGWLSCRADGRARVGPTEPLDQPRSLLGEARSRRRRPSRSRGSWGSPSRCSPTAGSLPTRSSRSPTAAGAEPTRRRGGQGAAIRRGLHDQLGLVVTEVKPFGLSGSAGSTPLRITVEGDPPSQLFGKLYARSHMRSDRWYKLGRELLYGRLEDEAVQHRPPAGPTGGLRAVADAAPACPAHPTGSWRAHPRAGVPAGP